MNYENFKTGFNKPAIFTAQTYGTKTTVEIDHCDIDLDEVMNAFETLIIGMGYSKDSLKDWVIEKASQYQEEDTEYLKDKLNGWKEDDEEEPLIDQFEWNKRRDSLADMVENYVNVPIHFYIDDSGKKKYDVEEMKGYFENKIKELENE